MSPSIQAKFLRVLEGHAFERIGGRKPIQVDVRILAATNRDLEEAVEDGDFRKDLYFRLHVAEIIAPPLRERKDDIEVLAKSFLQKFVQKTVDGLPALRMKPSKCCANTAGPATFANFRIPLNVR